MPPIFDYHRQVQSDEIDLLGHVNNLVYLKWMQNAAIAHSDSHGWTTSRFAKIGFGFMVRSHRIKYLRPAMLDENVIVHTWVKNFRAYTANRRYEIVRWVEESSKTQLLATAQTQWVYVDLQTGLPQRIPAEMIQSFEISSDEQILLGKS